MRIPCIPRCALSGTIAQLPSLTHCVIPTLRFQLSRCPPGYHPWEWWGFPGPQCLDVAATSFLMLSWCGTSSLCAVVGSSLWRCVKPGSIGTSSWAPLWHTKPLSPGTAPPENLTCCLTLVTSKLGHFLPALPSCLWLSSLAQQTPPNRSALPSQQNYARNFSPKAAGPFPKKESCQIPTPQPPAAKQGANLAPGGLLLASTSALAGGGEEGALSTALPGQG